MDIKVGKNKYLEIDIQPFPNWIRAGVEAYWLRKCDHAGFGFNVDIPLLLFVGITVYDRRHWDDEKERFLNPPVI